MLFFNQSSLAQNNNKPPDFQAIAEKLMEEINNNIQCRAGLITDKQENQKLKAEIEKLKKDKQ